MYKNISSLVPREFHFSITLLLFLFLFVSILETIGISLIIPLMDQLNSNDSSGVPILSNVLKNVGVNIPIIEKSTFLFLILILAFILKNIFFIFATYFRHNFLQKIFVSQSTKLLNIYLNQDYIFYTKNNSSKLIRNLSDDLMVYQSSLMYLIELISKAFIVIGILALMFFVNYKITIIILLSGILIFYIANILTKKKTEEWGKIRHENASKWIKNLQQAINSISILKTFQVKEYFVKQYNTSIYNLTSASKKHDNLQAVPRPIFEIAVLILFLFFFIIIEKMGHDFSSSISMISFYFLSVLRISPPILSIYKSQIFIKFGKKPVSNLVKEFKLSEKKISSEEKKISFKKYLQLKNISFKYPLSKYSNLKNINLKINKNEFIGIIGPSGSGKTTLINIILGLIAPTKGKIIVDGFNIHTNNYNWMRKIGYVPQSNYLLDASIVENISFKKKNSLDDIKKINKIINLLQLKEFVKKREKKLNLNVGEKGSKISEGQKQRIGIARALYKDPEIFILDEITSSLDNLTENKIMKYINYFKGKKTILFITHNVDILKNCDKIVNIDKGLITIKKNKK